MYKFEMVNKMTDKELRKLKRADLLEILYYLQKEIDELKEENAMLKEKAASFNISDSDLQRIAEAVKTAVGHGAGAHSGNVNGSSDGKAIEKESK